MCGRFTLKSPTAEVARQLGLCDLPELPPRYNVAPTQTIPIVRGAESGTGRQWAFARWGLVPSWADDLKIGNHMINARAETVSDKPAFRAAFRTRRCLIPADGFYEWQKAGGAKQPFHIGLKNGGVFAMAGLWERWMGPDGPVESCTIITTEANDLVRSMHDRMPVILPPETFDVWLDPELREPEPLESLLRPFPANQMTARPVSGYVNSPAHEGLECLAAAG